MDSLSVSTNTTLEKLKDYVDKLYNIYLNDTYKNDFPWVDHIAEIKDKSRISELESILFKQIAAGNLDKIWMAVPEIIEWEKVGGFCYLMNKNSPEYQDIHLPHFLESLRHNEIEKISKKLFAKKQIKCVDSDGVLIHQWQAMKCLYCEIEDDNQTYLLSSGKWYQIETDFVKDVNRYYSEIPNYKTNLPEYNDDSEGDYNKRIAASMPDKFALMDAKNIPYGGGYSKIEFCDLFSIQQDIIHIKRYGSSSVLSHLFSQGRVSGEIFQMESQFRHKTNKHLPRNFQIEDPDNRPKNDLYQIVFAIISEIPGELTIPFFSRLNLKNSCRNLQGLDTESPNQKLKLIPKRN